MPKIINHDVRRRKIAEATWQVILKKGMEGATVRNIAKEAGLSLGALRYYFQTQDELLVYAMELVQDRATNRIRAIYQQSLPPKEMAVAVLLEIIPMNEDTRAEMEVWFAFITYMKPKENAKDIVGDNVQYVIRKIMDYLETTKSLVNDIDLHLETERLYALVDGIALHAMMQPKRLSAKKIEETIRYHLNTICKS